MRVLVTGGAGYIGSHTALQLLNSGYEVVVFDNLVNSSRESLYRVEELTGKPCKFIYGDITEPSNLDTVFNLYQFDAVVHFAALKAVGESTQKPSQYYHNNVYGSLCLIDAMKRHNVKKLIFSSSATVYGEEAPVPYNESMPVGRPSSPYGASKVMVERMLEDAVVADHELSVVSLRYFNPIGAHPSGRMGEDPQGIPNNLLPFVAQVAVGRRECLQIFGDDYPTTDGTCERDYLHVMDLAEGHVAALDWLRANPEQMGFEVFNLGMGEPVSVMQIVQSFMKETDITIPYQISPRRAGDLPAFWANAEKAKNVLNWTCKRTLSDMMKDTWQWQSNNPQGYT